MRTAQEGCSVEFAAPSTIEVVLIVAVMVFGVAKPDAFPASWLDSEVAYLET